MSMGHAHDHDAHAADRTRLGIAIAIIGAFLVVQVVGGLLSGSLALLADAGHMTSDLLGLVIALGAAVVAARPATDRQTYGYRRFEVFGALANGVILVVVAVSVSIGAIARLGITHAVDVDHAVAADHPVAGAGADRNRLGFGQSPREAFAVAGVALLDQLLVERGRAGGEGDPGLAEQVGADRAGRGEQKGQRR